jgi:(R,R)-butanediol dehydrogenase/meso-butanediol dehydrogenase/diacetyl reductase
MKAALWYGQRDVRVENVPNPPAPGAGEIQIEVKWAGICGTDVHEYVGGPQFIPWDTPHPLTGHQGPTILGHEMSGEVVAIGSGVEGFKLGDRVVPDIVLYCGVCRMCRTGMYVLCEKGASLGLQTASGGFGEYVTMPAYTAHHIPDGVPYDIAAVAEPLSTAMRAIRQGRVTIGDTVAVIGGGATGMLAIQAAWRAGAKEVYMLALGDKRLRLASDLGARAVDGAQDPVASVLEATHGRGVDVVIDTGGTESSLNQSLEICATRGRVVAQGIFGHKVAFDPNQLVFYEKELVGSLGRDGQKDVETALIYLKKGWIQVAPLITKKIIVDEIVAEGFEVLAKDDGEHVKILVTPKGE